MNQFTLGYTTTANIEEARTIAKTLLEKKLIACANIIPQMESHYCWEGEAEQSQECVVILKTTTEMKSKLEETLQEIHSYDCPCLIFLPVDGGSSQYLAWLAEQVEP